MNLAIDLLSSEDSTSECDLSDDEIFARKLQKEFDAEPKSVEVFECPVCLEDKPIDSKFIYQNCDHVQCRECASEFFIRQIDLNNKINCVLCQQEVATLDLELVLSSGLVTKYLKMHNIEPNHEDHEDDYDNFEDVINLPTYVVPKRPVKPKAVKRVAPKIHAPHAKKIAAKKIPMKHNHVINNIRFNESNKLRHAFLDQEYVPGNTESGKKSYNTPHTRYDRTSSDSDSYDVPSPKKIRKVDAMPLLKRKLS
jgi:hypothetical protein